MKKYIKTGLLIVIFGLVVLVLSHMSSKTTETARVRIGYLPVVHALPLFIALEKGYFKDAGITVEVTKFEAPNQIVDALLSNGIDISMAGATGITAIAESKKPDSLRIFAIAGGDDSHVADGLIVSKKSTIVDVKELRGKKIGTLPGIQWRTLARNFFTQNGIDIDKDITLVELAIPLQTQALATNQVDALFTVEPILTIADSMGVSRELVRSPNLAAVSNPFYAGVGNVTVSFMKAHPVIFKKVMQIFDKATKEVNANPEESRHYFIKYTPLTEALAAKVNLPAYKMYSDMAGVDFDAVQKFIGVFEKYKVIERHVDVKTLVYHE